MIRHSVPCGSFHRFLPPPFFSFAASELPTSGSIQKHRYKRESSVGIARGWAAAVRFPAGARVFFLTVERPDRLLGRRLFPRGLSGRGVKMTTHLRLVPTMKCRFAFYKSVCTVGYYCRKLHRVWHFRSGILQYHRTVGLQVNYHGSVVATSIISGMQQCSPVEMYWGSGGMIHLYLSGSKNKLYNQTVRNKQQILQ
jgi:hypothetical protein